MPVRPKRRRAASAAALAATLVVAATAGSATADPEPLEPATVSADFGRRQGELPRSESFNNFGNVNAWHEQRPADVEFLNEQGLHGDIQRVWLSSVNARDVDVFNQCSLETNSCDLSATSSLGGSKDDYLAAASAVSDSVMIVLNPMDFVEGERPIDDLKPMVELILRTVTEEYPAVKYVEVFNEPDWQFHGVERRMGRPVEEVTLQPDELYDFYVPFYEVVNELNNGRPRADRLQVGGPALMWLDAKWMEPFLDAYAADPNPRKRLDFISYHAYLKWDDDYQVPTMYKDAGLDVVASDRTLIRDWLEERRIRKHIPSFVTETGIYPGPAFDDTDPANDYIRQAAGLATYSYLFANQPGTYMFNWCVRHRVQERKDQLVTRTPDGPAHETFTPYGNMLLMQSKMKDIRVSAVSGAPLVDDNGIYTIASKDKTGASLMVWNWQHVHDQSYQATIDMSRLPSNLRRGPVRQQVFRIDQETSNYFADAETADLQLVDEKVVTPGKTYSETIDLGPNAIYLVLLEPA